MAVFLSTPWLGSSARAVSAAFAPARREQQLAADVDKNLSGNHDSYPRAMRCNILRDGSMLFDLYRTQLEAGRDHGGQQFHLTAARNEIMARLTKYEAKWPSKRSNGRK
jgi:hypothetical protein